MTALPSSQLQELPRACLGCVFSERPFRKTDLDAVRRMSAEDIHNTLVGLGAGPILLQFEDVLARGHRNDAGLYQTLHGAVMRFDRQITRGVRRNVDFVSFLEHI